MCCNKSTRRSLSYGKKIKRLQVDARRRTKLRHLRPPPYPPPAGGRDARLLEKRQPENIQIIEKKQNISKQINKAMTKQYIYIYRYKKRMKMCNDSSIIFTQKCSHLYYNLNSFHFCMFFYSCIALSFFRTNQREANSRSASSWEGKSVLDQTGTLPGSRLAKVGAAGGRARCVYGTGWAEKPLKR